MTRYLVDTNVISELTKPLPSPQVLLWLQITDPAALFASVITLGEIRMGVEKLMPSKRRTELEHWVEAGLPAWFAANLLPVTAPVAERWAQVTMEARRIGKPIGTSDGLLAATAYEHGLVMLTRNITDFTNLGVVLVDPWVTAP